MSVQECAGVTWPSQLLLQVIQQSKALLVRHGGEGIVRIDVLQAGHQVGQRVVGSKGVHLRYDEHR